MTLRDLINELITQIDTQPGTMEVKIVDVDDDGDEHFNEMCSVQVEEVEGVQTITIR